MAVPLDPTGKLVALSPGIRLRTPGLRGNAESHRPSPGADPTRAFRDVERSTPELEQALSNENVTPQSTVEIANTREAAAAAAGAPVRSTAAGEAAIELQVAAPNQAQGQFVLSIDEAGVTTWNFARAGGGELDVTRGGEPRTYLIPRYVAPAPAAGTAPAQRGLFGALGRKLLKVLVFPLVEPVIGAVGEHYAHEWEKSKRPYRVRSFTPDDYAQPDGTPVDPGRWQELSRGRALLMIHGTFSRAHTAFAGLPAAVVGGLHQIYGGRVFAFDHFTISEDPRQNVEWLLGQIPADTKLNLDIVCHSRGGLVSRELSEKQDDFSLGSRRLQVGKVVFVAAPNAGTVLADGRYMGDFIDSHTNLLNFFPASGVTEVLEAIVTVAKMLSVGALEGLPGLQAMNPTGAFLADFNRGERGTDRYFALASNYDPKDPGLKAWAVNRLLDRIFQNAGNDLVVPTLGVYDQNGGGYFPIDDRLVFGPERGIWHGGFFSEPDAQQSILRWLAAP